MTGAGNLSSILKALLGAGALSLCLAGCGDDGGGGGTASGGSEASPANKGDKSLVILDTAVAPSLDNDGAAAADPALQQGLEFLREPLIQYPTTERDGVLVPDFKIDADGYEPALAESYSNEGRTWTFNLRKNVKSCAGNTMTADDVVYTFARGKSVSGAAPVAWFLGNVAGVFDLSAVNPEGSPADRELKGEVTKVDADTVRVKLLAPNDLFPDVLEIFPLYVYDSKEMRKNATDDDPWSHKYTDTKNAPGFGPYCLDSWKKGSEMRFSANPNYWRGEPAYTEVVLRAVPSSSSRVAAIAGGQADIATSLTPRELAQVGQSGRADVLSWSNNKVLALGINYRYAPFDDDRKGRLLRQAIAHAMPYDDIIKTDYRGKAKKWNGLVHSNSVAYKEIGTYGTDLAKAKQLMAEAGYPDGKGLPGGSPAFTLNYVVERESLLGPLANRIKTALAQIGIPVKLAPITQAEENTRELVKNDMGMFLRDYNRPLRHDAGYHALLHYVSKKSGGLVNSVNYENAEVDKLFVASQTTTGAEREQALGTLQDQLMEDLPLVPIAEVTSDLAVRKGITGWRGQTYDLVQPNYFK